jgi:hypothetical protein
MSMNAFLKTKDDYGFDQLTILTEMQVLIPINFTYQ